MVGWELNTPPAKPMPDRISRSNSSVSSSDSRGAWWTHSAGRSSGGLPAARAGRTSPIAERNPRFNSADRRVVWAKASAPARRVSYRSASNSICRLSAEVATALAYNNTFNTCRTSHTHTAQTQAKITSQLSASHASAIQASTASRL